MSLPLNFLPEVEKKLGKIMNSRNSDKEHVAESVIMGSILSGMGHLLAGWSPEILQVFTFPMDTVVLIPPKTRVSLLS